MTIFNLHKKHLLSALSLVGAYSLAVALPASAFTFSGDSVTIDSNDINQSFNVFFDGSINENNVSGLSSEAVFTFLGFKKVGSNTEAAFDILLKNTSSGGITSRTSALGFDVNLPLLGVGQPSGSENTRVSGLFTNDRSGQFPNGFGDIDVCFTNGNTCQGGSNGGVTTGNSGTFSPILAFSGSVNTFTLSNFGVRYQSITGSIGGSGTGQGTPSPSPSPTPEPVPEPSTMGAIVLSGLALLRYGKKRK
ncbi:MULTISPECIES: cistern family PEP-CTERM protein [Cyanophyceae]|uniref:cistern family PEP-CTERM protein n=1 Tax=Cyanophyceae TaxID=3028117 RepID=UPI001686CE78|nr:cistern family PEP-CTERM protein [Trichocoleus sp. FACHB-40]MBD2003089.1 cistern family PEP-CTERM protein [Trichocoleus sp. FACHB-40]